MNVKIGFCNLWLFSVLGYGIIWISMIRANKRRGKPIEDPDIYTMTDKKFMLSISFIMQIALIIITVLIPINVSILFWIGLPVYLAGILLNIISIHSFAGFSGGVNNTGIYRYSRNPMYVGGFLFILGLNIIGWSFSIISVLYLVLSVLWVSSTHYTVLQEEAFLLKKYGNAFLEYNEKVPRYFGI